MLELSPGLTFTTDHSLCSEQNPNAESFKAVQKCGCA